MLTVSPSLIILTLAVQAAAHRYFHTTKERQWALSAYNSALMSFYGVITLLQWLFDHGQAPTEFTDTIFLQLQSYMIVDLLYNITVHRHVQQSLLEFWVHHTVYIFVCSRIVEDRMTGATAVYFILEFPAALRAWGTLVPAWRTDAGFGAAFFLLRVLFPFLVFMRDVSAYPLTYIPVFVAMQGLHCYWFYRWCQSQLPRLLESALGGLNEYTGT